MKLLPFPAKVTWRDQAVGALLAIAYVAWLLATVRSLGFARDEGFYFRAATSYSQWFSAFLEHPSEATKQGFVDGIWGYNHEHPALMKSLFSMSWMLLHEKWKVFNDASTAFRFPTMVMGGMALWVTYLFGARAYSRRAGVIAAVLLALMPRVFYNAHLACFDVAIMAMWTLAIYVYWRAGQEGGIVWAILAGIVFGLTLETKHNAWILPAVFLPHALFANRHTILRQLRVGRFPVPASLVSMAILGPLVFYVMWPWMWNDTLRRLQEYVEFHVHHEYYNMEFLGVNYFGPPSPKGYLPVMVIATVPMITLLLFVVGAGDRLWAALRRVVSWFMGFHFLRTAATRVRALRHLPNLANVIRDKHETDLLFALAFSAAIGPFFLEKTPIFGGTKHWLPAYPFLALFAGRGFDVVASALSRAVADKEKRIRWGAHAALAASVVVAPLAITAHSHPFGLSTYVPLVGGVQGGASLGLNRQFWGYTTENANDYLAANARRGARVFIHDTAWDSWQEMLAEGRVRSDLVGVGSPSEAEYALVQHELHMSEVEYSIWVAFGTITPVHVVTHDGVPIVTIYKRPDSP